MRSIALTLVAAAVVAVAAGSVSPADAAASRAEASHGVHARPTAVQLATAKRAAAKRAAAKRASAERAAAKRAAARRAAARRAAARRAALAKAAPVAYSLTACAVDGATARGVELELAAHDATPAWLPPGTTALLARLGPRTTVALSDAAQAEREADGPIGSAADIWAGDRVRVTWRAPRGTAPSALPAATRVLNLGSHPDCLADDGDDLDDDDWWLDEGEEDASADD